MADADPLAQRRRRSRQHHVGNNTPRDRGSPVPGFDGRHGVELVQRGPFALDLQGRVGHTFIADIDGGPVINMRS